MLQNILEACKTTLGFSLTAALYLVGALFALSLFRIIFVYIKTSIFRSKLNILDSQLSNDLKTILSKHHLEDKVKVASDSKPFAFCLGVRNPRIYLSTQLIKILNKKELEAVILHEKYHLINKDNFFGLLSTFIKTMFMFLPIVSDYLDHLKLKREIRADNMASATLDSKKSVAIALRKLLSYKESPYEYAASFLHGQTLEKRIKKLSNNIPTNFSISMKSGLISVIVLVILSVFLLPSVSEFIAHIRTDSKSSCHVAKNCNHDCLRKKSLDKSTS